MGRGLTTEEHEGTLGNDGTVLYHDRGAYITVYICQDIKLYTSNYILRYVFYISFVLLKRLSKNINVNLGLWVFTVKFFKLLCLILYIITYFKRYELEMKFTREGYSEFYVLSYFSHGPPLCDLFKVSSTRDLLFMYLFSS